MPESYSSPLRLTRRVLRGLTILNLIMGSGILILLISSLLFEGDLILALKIDPDPGRVAAMRGIMLLGLLAVPFGHVILTRLTAMVDTVSAGDPFVIGNAHRIRTIAWSMLGLELINLVVGLTASMVSTPDKPLDIHWDPSLTRWLAILLCFVLASVFTHGARMREELEGTV